MAKGNRNNDPAQTANRQVLADRQARLDAQRKPVTDLGLNLPEQEISTAAEFLADEFDRKTFGEAAPTIKRLVYGPDPLFDGSPGTKAAIEKIGLHDYAEVAYRQILKDGAMGVADNVLRRGLTAAISKFGVEKVAEAFRERILAIPCREVEYEVDRDADVEIAGSRVLSDAVERYGRPGKAYKFLSPRCMDILGLRGYEIVKDEKGDPVKVGTLHLGEISELVAQKRRAHYAQLANEAIDNEVEKYAEEAERLAHQSRHSGVGPLRTDEIMLANASESQGFLGQSRPAGFTLEDNVNG